MNNSRATTVSEEEAYTPSVRFRNVFKTEPSKDAPWASRTVRSYRAEPSFPKAHPLSIRFFPSFFNPFFPKTLRRHGFNQRRERA